MFYVPDISFLGAKMASLWFNEHASVQREKKITGKVCMPGPLAMPKLSQRMTKSTIRLVRPAKTQISLRIRAVWSESSLIVCAFYTFQAIQRGINKKPCHTRWMYRLIWVFAGHSGLIVSFVVRWHRCLFLWHVRTGKTDHSLRCWPDDTSDPWFNVTQNSVATDDRL